MTGLRISQMAILSVLLCTPAPATLAEEPSWPQFRGPNRDGISSETGLLGEWPKAGPKLLWSVSGLGRGYSSPAIANDTLYITGDVKEELVISAYDLSGKLKWKITNGKSWKNPFPGARCTCTYDGGRLFHMNAHGRVVCLDPADGKELWAVNVLDRFEGKNIRWGISECLLVDGDHVIVTPGGKKALIAALDRETGETVWASEPLEFMLTYKWGGKELDQPRREIDQAGYAAPILFEVGSRRLIAGCSARHFFCADAETGKLVWSHPVFARYNVIGAIPIFWQSQLFFTVPGSFAGKMFRVHATPDNVRLEQLWETPVDNCHGALVLVDGKLYGSGYHRLKSWVCIDAATGDIGYEERSLAIGSVVYADGRLYALSESGTMALLKPTADGFETVGQFPIAKGKRRDVWAHLVICNGRLYLRDHDTMWCHDIRRE